MNHIQGSAQVKRRIVQCHYCQYSCQKIQSNMAKCCIKKCNKNFCIECIIQTFNKQFTMDMYRKDTWICFVCQQTCNCQKCKNYELGSAQKVKKKRGPKSHKNKQQNNQQIQLQNKSLKNSNQNMQKQQLLNIDIQKQFQYQPKQLDQIYNFQQYKIYDADEMALFPPHYRKRIAQKHMFCNFVVQSYKQNRQKKYYQYKKQFKQAQKTKNSNMFMQEKSNYYKNLFQEFNSKSE